MLTKDELIALDPRSGEALWKYRGYYNDIPIPSITSIGDGRVFVTGGYGAGSVMIKVPRIRGPFDVTELFQLENHGSQIHPFLLFNGYLYANFNTNENLEKTRMSWFV